MFEILENITRTQNILLKLENDAFKTLCDIIQKVCDSKTDKGVKINKNCFIVHASHLYNRPWSLDILSNEIANKVLQQQAAKLFQRNNKVEDVIQYFKDCVTNNKKDIISVNITPKEARLIETETIREILTLINSHCK